MKEQKTIEQWLKKLPRPLRNEAFEAMRVENRSHYLLIKITSLSDAIYWGFTWEWSESGNDFWHSFYLALKWAEKHKS